MKTKLLTTLLMAAFAITACAADFKTQNNKMLHGIRTSTADKLIEVDTNDGASNPKFKIVNSDKNWHATTNKFKFGDAAASDKTLEADKGLGATNPKMRFNNTSGVWQISNDGTAFFDIGTGAVVTNTFFVSANIAGANPSLGTSAQTAYTGITNSSLTLTNNTGSVTAQIACAGTTASSGTTCTAADESLGVAFTIASTGTYKACASGAVTLGGATGSMVTFQIVETPNTAQTISTEGNGRIHLQNSAANAGQVTLPFEVCGIFVFGSTGQKTLRLFYEQNAVGAAPLIYADASGTDGQRDLLWTVYRIAD